MLDEGLLMKERDLVASTKSATNLFLVGGSWRDWQMGAVGVTVAIPVAEVRTTAQEPKRENYSGRK
jgi:hypothetical protein